MQRKFQQSKVFLFIDRLVVSVVSETGTHSAFSKTVTTPLVQFLDRLLTPVVYDRCRWPRQYRRQWSCRRCSSWRLVPQIMEEIYVVIHLVDVPACRSYRFSGAGVEETVVSHSCSR